MVIIITGASHTGKTLLAQRLIEKYKYPCLSEDHLKMGLIRSGNTCLTPESLLADNARFSERARRCGAEICLIDGEYNVNPDIRKMLWR